MLQYYSTSLCYRNKARGLSINLFRRIFSDSKTILLKTILPEIIVLYSKTERKLSSFVLQCINQNKFL